MAGVKEMESMEEFLNHKGKSSGGSFLGNWRKADGDGKVTVWLHTKILPIALWQHAIPKIVVREEGDDDTAVRHVWTGKHVCHEDESVLKRQYYRDRTTGARDVPPQRCGLCKMIEHIRSLVESGKLREEQAVFRFEGDDPEETKVLHAAGLYNGFPKNLKDATAAQVAAYKAAHLRLGEVWQEVAMAKLSYAFAVVDNADPEKGVQIAVETGLLGDMVKDVINDSIESLGAEAGNPQLHPYAIQWVYLHDEKQFNKKYKARRLEQVKMTPAIERAIKGPKPDLSGVTAAFEPKALRAQLERACLVRDLIPWDALFKDTPKPVYDVGEFPSAEEGEAVHTADDEEIECDVCGKGMRSDAAACETCGTTYDLDSGKILVKGTWPKVADPPRQMRKRAAKKQEKAKPADDQDNDASTGDDIPF